MHETTDIFMDYNYTVISRLTKPINGNAINSINFNGKEEKYNSESETLS